MTKHLDDNKDLAEKLETLRETLSDSIIGQPQAVEAVVSTLELYKAGMHDFKRPIGSFLFLGPSGVGKTYTVEKIAELLLPPDALIKVDCAEFSLDHDVAKIHGSPPGYVGSEQGSYFTKLIEKISEPDKGFILLLDEIEKAHPRFFDAWLSVLDKGRLTDSKGKVLDFTRSLIFMTSNVGAKNYDDQRDVGFRPVRPSDASVISQIQEEVKRTFKTEFLNRISGQVQFFPLTLEQQAKIFANQLAEINGRLAKYSISVEVGKDLQESIYKAGFSKLYGARELRRQMIKQLEQPLARLIIRKMVREDSLVFIEQVEGVLQATKMGDYPVLIEMKSIASSK